jgi:hypothetical protein
LQFFPLLLLQSQGLWSPVLGPIGCKITEANKEKVQ